MKLLLANQADAAKRRVFFFCVDATDGITPETGEATGQPQVSIDGGLWSNTDIGTLVSQGNGYYYAELAQNIAVVGRVLTTRYKSANTAEAPGTTVQVVAFDPDSVAGLGLTNLDAAVSSRSTFNGGAVASVTGAVGSVTGTVGTVTATVDAIKLKTDLIPASLVATLQRLIDLKEGSWSLNKTTAVLTMKDHTGATIQQWQLYAANGTTPDATTPAHRIALLPIPVV